MSPAGDEAPETSPKPSDPKGAESKMMVITGATGQVGGEVLRRLVQRDVHVRALVRNPAKAQSVRRRGVETVEGDFARPETLVRALEGADTMFLTCANVPEQVELESDAIEAAVRAGVRRVVKLSVLGAQAGSPVPFRDWHGRIEERLRDSGTDFTILRPNFFMQGLPGLVGADGNIHAPTGDGRVGTITGPESLSLAEVADKLSEAAGREIRHIDVSSEAAREGMVSSGMSEWFAEALLTLFAAIRRGGLDAVTDTVSSVGRVEPRPVATFARELAPTLDESLE
jgi:uncharacterized protein YbjT (DUF2867 family)